MSLKNEAYGKRISKGNEITELNFDYLSKRFSLGIDKQSGTKADISYGQDGTSSKWKKTLQGKARDSKHGDDILQEALLILPEPLSSSRPSPPFKVKEGRDMHGFSDYTTCMPSNKTGIVLVETPELHEYVYNGMREWIEPIEAKLVPFIAHNGKECYVVETSEEILEDWVRSAFFSHIKAYHLFTSNKFVIENRPIQIWCNVDNAKDNHLKTHGKIIVYVPWQLLKHAFVAFRDGEVWNEPKTWLGSQKEDIRKWLK